MGQRFIFRTVTLSGLVLGALSLMLTMPVLAKADGPISYWKLDETGEPYDDFYNVQDGECVPGECPTMTTTAVVTNGQVFNGTSNGIDVSANAAFDWDSGDSFAIEFWMKGIPGQTCAGGNEVIISRVDNSSSPLWSLGCTNTSGYAYFHLSDTGGISTTLESTKIITNGVWHHVVGVRDSVNGINRLYVDGQEVVSQTITYSNSFSSTAGLNIGWLNIGSEFHFNGTIDEVALYDGALSETEIRTHYYLARGYAEACAAPVRIMPLGDSITKGSQSPNKIGYRKQLTLSLTTAGYYVDFVGSQSNGTSDMDRDHQGHSGRTDDWIASTVYDFLNTNPADVVLLHIGTNDLLQNPPDNTPDDIEDILDEIDRNNENITVVLARIVNQYPTTTTVTTFNDDVQAMAFNRIANGDKIIIVDQESALTYPDDMAWDGVHPNITGYNKMAGVWLDALDDFLPICNLAAPAITSTPVTTAIVGQLYTYNVDASGVPAPTYTLTVSQTGMTINSASGVISWTPSVSGTFDVAVVASNTINTDTQSYTITVNALAPISLPGRIEAEDYKEGGEGVGYHDTTPGNSGGEYRSDDVDIAVANDIGGGYTVGWIESGEWLAFDVDVNQTGEYDITARVASGRTGTKTFHITVDGVDVTGPMSFTDASGWQSWLDLTVTGVQLTAGIHELRIVMDTGPFNINYVDVDLINSAIITIAKMPDIQTVVSGSSVTFTIFITNTGDVTLTNIFITDPLAPDCDRTMGMIGDLTPTNGTSYTCTLANVTTAFTNSVTVTGSTLLGDIVVSDTDTAVVTVNLGPSPGSGTIYLPLIIRGHTPPAPDLIVENIIVTSNNVQVVIRNQGNASVLSAGEFWVDLYIDPYPVPTGVNQVWDDGRSTQDIVWGVTAPVLPLAPGDTITLTYGDAYTWPYPVSNFSGTFVSGMAIYVQVDSANTNDPIYGAVKENHELVGGAYYNNITSVVFSASTTVSGEAMGISPSVVGGTSTFSSNLPPRP